MKKILVLHRYPPKQVIGTNASFVEFLKKLLDSGLETYYLTYKEKVCSEELSGVNYIRLPFYFERGNNFDKVVKTYLWIILIPFYIFFLNRKTKFDLVYCDDSVPFYGFLTKLINPNLKVIIRLGDLQTGYSLADKNKKLFNFILKIEKFMWSKLDGLIAISAPFKDFITLQGIPVEKVKVVEESINLDELSVSPSVLASGNILFHGSIVPCKGLITLVEAFKLLNEKYPKTNLIIAGSGSELPLIKDHVLQKNLRNIEFTGWYDHEVLAKIMKNIQFSIVMRSSNLANNFVVTTCLLENWAFRKPVIVPDLEAFRGVIKEKVNGVFFTAGDVASLVNSMEYLYLHKEEYPKLAENGFATARGKFYYKDIARKMVSSLLEFL